MKSPHLSQRMARWLSFFAEYNFVVHYKSGKNNILAHALSRRPDYDPRVVLGRQVIDDEDEGGDHCAVCAASDINLTSVSPEMDLRDEIVAAYTDDAVYANILAYLRSTSDETLGALDADSRNGVLIFVDRFTKMVHLTPVSDTVIAAETGEHFVDCVFRHHGLPESIISDRDPRFTSAFWTALFQLLETKLSMSTAVHPETDGQTDGVNRVLEDVLRSYATSFASWSKFLPLAGFALNNAEHASTGLTPFFANNARHPRVPAFLAVGHPTVSGASTLGRDDDGVNDDYVETSGAHDPETLYAVTRSKAKQALATPEFAVSPLASPARQIDNAAVSAFVQRRASIARFARDALQEAVDKQKENADKREHKNMATFWIGEQVLLIEKINGEAYTLDIPTPLRLHPTFYVRRLKKYHPAAIPSTLDPTAAAPEHSANTPPFVPSAALQRHVPDAVLEYESEIANENENAAAADHAATKIATENTIGADPVTTEIANDHAPTGMRPAENERGGLCRE
ncbi:Retrotransposon nucleocapsid protein [Phytophthora palmivora]|uniref:Retrotransposon nucleocapsid protein n=1 Tax=Phytophthora palmivora TaxID=4796 RepID=A0A2P4YVI3_9STRA|nr:Retrotransposon nucleocapsid protein [Phytophthora palmivora]